MSIITYTPLPRRLFPCLVPAAFQESPLKKKIAFFSLTFVLAALLFIAEHGLSLVVARGLLWLQRARFFRVELGLSSCGIWASLVVAHGLSSTTKD